MLTSVDGRRAWDELRPHAQVFANPIIQWFDEDPSAAQQLLPCEHAVLTSHALTIALGRRYLTNYRILQLHPSSPSELYAASVAARPPWVQISAASIRVLYATDLNIPGSLPEDERRILENIREGALATARRAGASVAALDKNSVEKSFGGPWSCVQILSHSLEDGSFGADDGPMQIDVLTSAMDRCEREGDFRVRAIDVVSCGAFQLHAERLLGQRVPSVTSAATKLIGTDVFVNMQYHFWQILSKPAPEWLITFQHAWVATNISLYEVANCVERPFPEHVWG